MSLYQMMHGVNPAAFFILPMLDKHPDEYPRFRDCFVKDKNIQVLTRTGGGNREEYFEANEDMKTEHYITDYDNPEDCTYAYWEFKVPEQWQADFDLIITDRLSQVSRAYVAQLKKVFPKLDAKFCELFPEPIEKSGENCV